MKLSDARSRLKRYRWLSIEFTEDLPKMLLERDMQIAKLKAVVEVARELLDVAEHRGDNVLPCPEDDHLLFNARMQTAWDEIEEALEALDADCANG